MTDQIVDNDGTPVDIHAHVLGLEDALNEERRKAEGFRSLLEELQAAMRELEKRPSREENMLRAWAVLQRVHFSRGLSLAIPPRVQRLWEERGWVRLVGTLHGRPMWDFTEVFERETSLHAADFGLTDEEVGPMPPQNSPPACDHEYETTPGGVTFCRRCGARMGGDA